MTKKRRILSVLLAAVLTFTSMSTFVSADEEPQDISGEGLCEHHPEHTEDCGYDEAAGNPCRYVCEECGDAAEDKQSVTYITDWSWIDEEGNLQDIDGVWGIGMPGVSESNPLTRDALLSMLPTQVIAVTADGEEVTIDITWDLSLIPDAGIWSGDHTFTASLEGAYNLEESVPALSVKVELGGADTLTTLPSGTPPFSDHIENGVSPRGTTINLFDYWVGDERTAADNSDPWVSGTLTNGWYSKTASVPDIQNNGINVNHTFLFGAALSDDFGIWNEWTGNSNPRTGIVKDELVNGYPILDLTQSEVNNARYVEMRNGSSTGYYYSTLTGRTPEESLAYLFDPAVTQEGKASYSDVEGLLQVDNQGYYYYDSTQNYAAFYEGSNSFVLYDTWGVNAGGNDNTKNGQFFPFNAADDVMQERGNTLSSTNIKSTDENLNHYFGLTMSTRFIQQYDGYTTEDRTTEVTYDFSGDDDVWVFIDDVLVADLGGIHNASELSINFVTGVITINGREQSRTLGDILNTGSDTLVNNTYHTLDFFYLERGNTDSNMKLKYNLVTIPESSVIKVDQTGDPVADAEFSLYADDDMNNPIARGTTDASGEFIFVDENDFPITIQNLYDQYKGHELILRETKVPDGYRTAGDMRLRFFETQADEVLLLSDNAWDTGAYAMSKATSTAPNTISLVNGDTINLQDEENPTMFVVIMQKQEDGSWHPVYGDPLNGWTVTDKDTMEDVKEAAQANPYLFQLASSGAYQCEIENLPGDVKTYYHVCQDEETAQYAAAYYYTTTSNLNDINESNTWRIDGESEENPIERVFSVNLYVPNIKNRLFVQKVDDEGTPVNGADFALYKADDVTINNDGTVEINPGSAAYDDVTTMYIRDMLDTQGAAVFPTENKALVLGEYYLIETSAPDGYILNENTVHIVIDNTGVYADAGTAEDGITVLRGVGSLVRSMIQFAVDDKVDATLNQIKTGLASGEYSDGSFTWETIEDADWENGLKQQYANDYNVLDYGLIGATEKGDIDSLTLKTEGGWSRLYIQQLYDEEAEIDTQYREPLYDQDLTNLFSGSVFVRVENQRVGTLRISKTVTAETGQTAPADTQFSFQLSLWSEDGTPLTGISGVKHRSDGGTEDIEEVTAAAGFTLADGEYIDITGLPAGTTYQVQEVSVPAGFIPSVVIGNGASQESDTAGGTIGHTTDAATINTVAYTNTVRGAVDFSFMKANRDNAPLSGAIFAVYQQICDDDHANDLIEVDASGNAEDSDCWKLIGKAVSGEDGAVTFNSLTKGTYRLVEIKAPDGYVLPNGQWIIAYNEQTSTFTVPVNGSIGNPPAYNAGTGAIVNYQPGQLPFSGNIGIRLFLIIGGTLMLLSGTGGVIWYRTHRKGRAGGSNKRQR